MAIASTSKPPAKSRVSQRERREWITGYLFILPATLLIAIFGLFPIIYAIYMSVHNWRLRKGAFIGLTNVTTRMNVALGIQSQGFAASCGLPPLASPSGNVASST